MKAQYKGFPEWRPPSNNYGYEHGRSREEAMLVHMVGSWRLKRSKITHNTTNHDGTNAFQCTAEDSLFEAQHALYNPKDVSLNTQRITHGVCKIGVMDRDIELMP